MGVDSRILPLKRAVFLDRDGVVNQAIVRDGKPYPPADLDELRVLPETEEALAKLAGSGFVLLVVTNQPDVARGSQQRSSIDAMHDILARKLPLSGFYVCCHDDRDGCVCRKPKPGLLLKAAAEHYISLTESYLIGDRWRDIEAGQRAFCRTVWIDYGYTERGPSILASATVRSVAEASQWILQQETQKNKEGIK